MSEEQDLPGDDGTDGTDGPLAGVDSSHSMEDLRISAQLRIGTTTLPLRSILNIKVGEVIALDRPLAAPVQVIAGGRTVASGELVLVNGFFAVDIKEVSAMEMHLPVDVAKH